MKSYITRAVLGVALVQCCAAFASAQSSLTISLVVTYSADLGANGYGIEIYGASNALRSGLSITAPDGTAFQRGPGAPLISVGSLTLSELTTRFSGDWTINDNWNLTVGTPTQHHRFSIDAAALTSFPATTPEILSPPNGSRNGYYLWVEATNVEPTSYLNLLLSRDNLRYWSGSPLVSLIDAGLRGPVEARAMSYTFTDINVTKIDASPVNEFHARLYRGNFSAPMNWTVGVFVPEPSSIATSSFALLSLAALRRRK